MAFFMNSGGRTVVPSGVTVGWVGTNASIPTGYSRVTALDSRFAKQIATTGTNPGATGGASSHQHSFGGHTHSVSHNHTGWPASSSDNSGFTRQLGSPKEGGPHSHAMSSAAFSGSSGSGGPANWSSTSAEPATLVVIFIASDGTPSGIPSNAICYFNGAAPSGWAEYLSGANRMWKGAAAGGDGGGTADTSSHTHGSAAHNHSLPAHTHTLALDANSSAPNINSGSEVGGGHTHTHTVATASSSDGVATSATASPTNDAGDATPPWQKMLTIQNTSGIAKMTLSIICVWTGTLASIPTKWALCDGLGGRPNLSQDKYVRGANGSVEVGGTGGAATHSHGGGGHTHTDGGVTHSHTGSGTSDATDPVDDVTQFPGSNASAATASHTHSIGTAASAAVGHGSLASATPSTGSATNDPTFTAVAYIQYTG